MADNSRILVVDDDAGVRSVTGEMLRGMGFDVVTAEGGEQALDHYGSQRFDLILLDVSMPRLSGADVFRAVRGQDAEQRVIFMTGYSRDDVAELLVDDSTDALAKPFPMRTLQQSVESMLKGSPGASDQVPRAQRSARAPQAAPPARPPAPNSSATGRRHGAGRRG